MVLELKMPRGTGEFPLSAYGSDSPPIVVLLSGRHGGKANEGFFDGRVEMLDPKIFEGTLSDITTVDAFHVHMNVFADR